MTIDRRQVPLGVSDPADESGAWEALRRMMREEVQRVLPGSGCKPGTVAELVPAFLEAKAAEVQPDTHTHYTQHLGWLVKRFGGLAVSALEVSRLCAQAKAEPSWGDTHRANVLWTAGAFLRWCGRAEKIPRPAKQPRGGEAVIPDEVHRMILNETHGDFRQFVRFLWLTGCRPGEAAELTAESVDWEAGVCRLAKHKTAHRGKVRLLYLSSEAREVLSDQRVKHGTGYLFRGMRGKPYSKHAVAVRFLRVSERIGKNVTAYGYRHTFATRALAAGVPDAQVAAMLGHSSTAMVSRVYGHLGEQSRLLRDVAERVNRAG